MEQEERQVILTQAGAVEGGIVLGRGFYVE
jgi:hypothetical protein